MDLEVRLGVRIPKSLQKALVSTAASKGLSMSEYARQALSECIFRDFLEHSQLEGRERRTNEIT